MKIAVPAIVLLVIPYLLLSVPGVPPPLGRTIGASILCLGAASFFILGGLVPKLKLISVGPKLRRPEFDDIRPMLERRLRLIAIGLGVFMLFLARPLVVDVVHLCKGERPVQIVEIPRSTSSVFGLWFLVQFVNVSPSEPSHTLIYSVSPIRAGRKYEFLLLPRSHLILDFHELDSESQQ
jgi:hypothetical protein